MAIFKGFKQVLQSEYDATLNEEKKGYMWLVRENAEAKDGKIYFGTRLYTPLSTGNGNAVDAYTKEEVDEFLKSKIGTEEFSAMSALVADIMNLIGLTVGEEEISLTLSEAFNGATTVVAALELLANKLSDVENAVVVAQSDATQALANAAAAQATANEAKSKIDAFLSDNAVTEGVVDTLKEIQDYITSDGAAADKLTQDVAAAQATADEAKDAVAELKQEVIDNKEVVSTALNDLKDKVDTVEAGAQANVIEKVKLFGNELEVAEDKSVDVEFGAKDVVLGTTVDTYGADAKVTDVLQGIINVLNTINGGESDALDVAAGDDSVIVSGESVAKTIAVQISSAEGNRLVLNTTEGEKGLYVEPLYYDGDDAEV